jgi:hypothetical protein
VLIVLRQMLDAIVSHRLRLAAGQGRAMDFFDITMPTHIRGPFKPAPYPSGGRDWAGAGADAHQAMIKRFHLWVFAILLAGSATVGLIALRTAIFVWRFHY